MSTESTFPQARLDAMREAARAFNPQALPTDLQFNLTNNRVDAAESAFVARQLEHMRPGLFEVKYPALKGLNWVPANYSVDPGAESYTIQIMDKTGDVQITRDFGTHAPMVNVSITERSVGFFSLTNGYTYSFQEARAAMMARQPLQARKAMACREAMARKMDEIALLGETTMGLTGLFTQSGTTVYSTPQGAGLDTEFSSKSSDEILLDLNGAMSQVALDTLEAHIPDTMILPLSSRDLISTRRVGDGTDRSVMQFFLANSAYPVTIEQSVKLETNSNWTGKRGVVYKKDPNVLEMIISQQFEQFAPEVKGFVVETLCHARTAGVACYFPKAIAYFDEI
jgi:hypothetical protein